MADKDEFLFIPIEILKEIPYNMRCNKGKKNLNQEELPLFDKIDQLGVNTLRTLSIEAVQKANSGHPGLPMGAAPMAYALWTKHLKVNPTTSHICGQHSL